LFTFETITVLVVMAIFVVFAIAANKAEKVVIAKAKALQAQKSTPAPKMATAKGKK
jgi:biopolymer transport protein ExbD